MCTEPLGGRRLAQYAWIRFNLLSLLVGIKPLELKEPAWDEKLSLTLILVLRRMMYALALYQK